jgi:hypothetical protein
LPDDVQHARDHAQAAAEVVLPHKSTFCKKKFKTTGISSEKKFTYSNRFHLRLGLYF